jgi:predicted Zn finger-like uncharacterized protein
MKRVLHTKCPACETTFALTAEQLAAREGLVRCGRCSAVFRADQHLLHPPRSNRPRARARVPASSIQPAPAKPLPARLADESERKQTPVALKIKVQTTVQAPPSPPTAEELISPLLVRLLGRKRHPTIPRSLWTTGVLLLTFALVGQVLYFYPSELTRYQLLKPLVLAACERLGCQVRARQDVARIDVLHTSVAPNPAHAKALRISVSMVNRAGFTQPYPSIELTLTDSTGTVVARRTLAPSAYLAHAGAVPHMLPQVVVDVDFDIASPDPPPGGYEIRLVER